MDIAQKTKVSEEAKQQTVSRLDTYYRQLSNDSLKQSNIAFNEAKDRAYSSRNNLASVNKVHEFSKEAERSERLKAISESVLNTTKNFNLILDELKKE